MKEVIVGISSLIIVLIIGIFSMYISYSNQEVGLRNQIIAKQKDNTSEFDNMWKKISQTAQVTEKQKDAFKDIFNSYVQGRGSNTNNNTVFSWVKENVPNVDLSIYNQLVNIITASRNEFTTRQKELLDLKREHDNLIDKIPSKFFVGSRGKIDVIIVTSDKTEETFRTGKDNDTSVF